MAPITEPDAVRVLTVRQPWADALAYLGKDIENRSRRTTYTGVLYIQAGLRPDPDAYAQLPSRDDLPGVTGAVIAVARLTGAHHECDCSCSTWAFKGAWHWEIADAVPLTTPVTAKGRLGLWIPDTQLRAQVAAVTPSPHHSTTPRSTA
ncbi:hypothetical protein [Streptomyces sp. CT34]|uniref:hypothetical protein n=1 Tax=Streptomyces sp. CT34 TaxID=1553907 RepID=UPI00068C8FF1|nr:hypothetical protein [Streptomyces sp. CT34]